MGKGSSQKTVFSVFQPALAWIGIWSLVLLTLFLYVVGAAKILNYLFPLGAFAVGVLLYLRYPLLYCGFTWWIWFLSPLIRRLVDYRSSFTNPSPILLAPYLVTLISLVTFLQVLPRLNQKIGLAFAAAFLGIFYAYLVGMINVSPVTASVNFLEWICPVAFGFHLFIHWSNYPEYKQHLQKVFLWTVLITGSYGIFQYLVAPEWDRYWLEALQTANDALSFGRPEPLQIRVWSTMNGPGVFGAVMSCGLLLLLGSSARLYLPASIVGYISLLLSVVRSAWIGWLVGVLVMFSTLKQKHQIRLFFIAFVISVCVIPLALSEPFSEVITERLQTMTDLGSDGSGIERRGHYDRWLVVGLTNFVGGGIGSTQGILLDSAILDTLLSLGLFGTLLYAGGLLFLLTQMLILKSGRDAFSTATQAVAISMFSQIVFGSVMLGLPGMLLWSFLGISLASQAYLAHTRASNEMITIL